MNGLKSKLTQKIGPLPAFAWVLILVIGFLLYRKFMAGSSSATPEKTADGTYDGIYGGGVGDLSGGSSSEYHDPIPLEPGQSIYDPQTGKIITGPDAPKPDEPYPKSPEAPQAPASQTTPAPHPRSSKEIITSVLHRSAVSQAVKAAAKKPKAKPKATTVKVKPTSPAVHHAKH